MKEFYQKLESHNIRIKWERNYRPLQDYLLLNSTSKTEYLEGIRDIIFFVKNELEVLPKSLNKENKSEFYNHISRNRSEYTKNFLAMSDLIPLYECKKLNYIL